jgi:hypothetical protein
MFPTVTIKHDMADLAKWADGMAADQLPFITALALTKTGQDVKRRFEQETNDLLQRPTPYTLRGWRLFPATKTKLKAEVGFRSAFGSGTDARDYLGPQVFGGQRKAKALEVALRAAGHLPAGWLVVPGQGAKLDQYGNVTRGQIIQVLSQLRITMTSGYTRNMAFNAGKARAAQRQAGGRYIVIKPGAAKAAPGVYHREFLGQNITPVFIFVRAAGYKTRIPMEEIARRVVADRLQPNFLLAWQQALVSARGAR